MLPFFVRFQVTLLCAMIVTLITSILDTFMFRLNMFCQIIIINQSLIFILFFTRIGTF